MKWWCGEHQELEDRPVILPQPTPNCECHGKPYALYLKFEGEEPGGPQEGGAPPLGHPYDSRTLAEKSPEDWLAFQEHLIFYCDMLCGDDYDGEYYELVR